MKIKLLNFFFAGIAALASTYALASEICPNLSRRWRTDNQHFESHIEVIQTGCLELKIIYNGIATKEFQTDGIPWGNREVTETAFWVQNKLRYHFQLRYGRRDYQFETFWVDQFGSLIRSLEMGDVAGPEYSATARYNRERD